MKSLVPEALSDALARLSPLQRDLLLGLLRGEEGGSDEAIARRHGTGVIRIRRERILARQRLKQILRRDETPRR
jgi:DNA-directed RNA polymerase specialized sigma24 family protein